MEPTARGAPDGDWQDEPIGPDDLTIRTPDGTVAAPESWLALVYSAVREPGGFLIVCSGPPDPYAQAINHEGTSFWSTGTVPRSAFQVMDVPLPAVADALSQWMNGDRQFIDDHEWQPVSL